MSSANLSTTIKKLREKNGFSQEKLARLADISNNTVIKIEAGKNQNPTLDTLKKIASAFKITVDELIK
ncbi:MAG: helix-turn-helix transcriptional regulator [Patescibacteria group bacterium]